MTEGRHTDPVCPIGLLWPPSTRHPGTDSNSLLRPPLDGLGRGGTWKVRRRRWEVRSGARGKATSQSSQPSSCDGTSVKPRDIT